MRNPERIGPILAQLAEIWYSNPDLRLMQLLLGAIPAFEQPYAYGLEDEALISLLKGTYD